MNAIKLTFAALLFAAPLLPVEAKQAQALPDCVTLSPSHQGTRVSGNEQILLKDGDAHYRVDFKRHCDAVARSSQIHVETDGQRNQLCPAGSSVRTRNASCTVRSVEAISADEYDRHARRNRR